MHRPCGISWNDISHCLKKRKNYRVEEKSYAIMMHVSRKSCNFTPKFIDRPNLNTTNLIFNYL
jgi:hypothetical protein